MNKYTKFLALMSFALVMSACQDDNVISVAPALPGDDIVFGATGYLESGDKGTRTIYGDVYEDSYGKHIQVKWVKGTDRMDIACPQSATAGNVKIAEYKVMDESNSVVEDTLDLDEEIDSIRIENSSLILSILVAYSSVFRNFACYIPQNELCNYARSKKHREPTAPFRTPRGGLRRLLEGGGYLAPAAGEDGQIPHLDPSAPPGGQGGGGDGHRATLLRELRQDSLSLHRRCL